MFVILQCWYNLELQLKKQANNNNTKSKKPASNSLDAVEGGSSNKAEPDLEEKMGLTMQHAGVAITVTSLTDVFAFGVGAVTVRSVYNYSPLGEIGGLCYSNLGGGRHYDGKSLG